MHLQMEQELIERFGSVASATEDDIKKVFRTLARHLHPDHNPAPDASRQFSELTAHTNALLAARQVSTATTCDARLPVKAQLKLLVAKYQHSSQLRKEMVRYKRACTTCPPEAHVQQTLEHAQREHEILTALDTVTREILSSVRAPAYA